MSCSCYGPGTLVSPFIGRSIRPLQALVANKLEPSLDVFHLARNAGLGQPFAWEVLPGPRGSGIRVVSAMAVDLPGVAQPVAKA